MVHLLGQILVCTHQNSHMFGKSGKSIKLIFTFKVSQTTFSPNMVHRFFLKSRSINSIYSCRIRGITFRGSTSTCMPTILDHSVSGNPPDTERISHSTVWVTKFPRQFKKKSVKNTFSDILSDLYFEQLFGTAKNGKLLISWIFILLGWHLLYYHITNKYLANFVWYCYLTNRLLWKQLVWASQLNLESIISCKKQNKNMFLIQLADNAIWLELQRLPTTNVAMATFTRKRSHKTLVPSLPLRLLMLPKLCHVTLRPQIL